MKAFLLTLILSATLIPGRPAHAVIQFNVQSSAGSTLTRLNVLDSGSNPLSVSDFYEWSDESPSFNRPTLTHKWGHELSDNALHLFWRRHNGTRFVDIYFVFDAKESNEGGSVTTSAAIHPPSLRSGPENIGVLLHDDPEDFASAVTTIHSVLVTNVWDANETDGFVIGSFDDLFRLNVTFTGISGLDELHIISRSNRYVFPLFDGQQIQIAAVPIGPTSLLMMGPLAVLLAVNGGSSLRRLRRH